ncbi:MAG: outer membrane lipoprotein carrier protein LolA [Acidobacteria bacterium]|nr:outer membrane lipoprotein carrier protein LolA [Acidobacteriota bacterium]
MIMKSMTVRMLSLWLLQAGGGDGLEQALQAMESVGKTFRTFQARFSQTKYTAILEEFDVPETGEFIYARAADGSALLRQEVTKPGTRILTIKGGVATVYNPTIKQAQVVNLGKNKDKAEYLALGLGQSPARLRDTFDLGYGGVEKVGASECHVLTLKPRNPAAAAYFSSITLWLERNSGLPAQQKLTEPSGDYLLVTFSKAGLNRKVPDSKFEQKLPPDVQIQRIQ